MDKKYFKEKICSYCYYEKTCEKKCIENKKDKDVKTLKCDFFKRK